MKNLRSVLSGMTIATSICAAFAIGTTAAVFAAGNGANPPAGPDAPSATTTSKQTLPQRETNASGSEGHWAVYPGAPSNGFEPQVSVSPQTVAGSCTYYTEGDLVHWSATAGQISAHGWWETPNFNLCPTYAIVTVTLQGFYCDGPCYWRAIPGEQQQPNPGTVRPRNVYGDWVNARFTCVGSTTVSFRSVIDVDLVGVSDPSDTLTTTFEDYPCLPPG